MADWRKKYKVERSLGRGGIGEAFLVQDPADDQLWVIKEVPRDAFAKKIESLQREFSLLARLAHPNIARVMESGEDDRGCWFREEFVDGPDIFRAAHTADYNQVLSCFVQILRALHYLHSQGILHGDLKAENILVVTGASLFQNDAVKLIDFGLARHLGERGKTDRPAGTLHFMAPEILLERDFDHRADFYALGVCLYRMITGTYPFASEEGRLDRLVQAQIERIPVEPKRFRADLPRGLNELAMRLLQKKPEERPESAQAILERLNAMEGEKFPLQTAEEMERRGPPGPQDVSVLQEEKKKILELAAFSKVPLSGEILGRMTGIPSSRLNDLLAALKKEGWIHRTLYRGTYHYRTDEGQAAALLGETPKASAESMARLIEETCRAGGQVRARHLLEVLVSRFGDLRALPRDVQVKIAGVASLVCLETGDLAGARRWCRTFLEISSLSHEEEGKILNRLGWIEYREGRYQEALKIFEKASEAWKGAGDPEGLAAVANFKGMAYQALRDWEKARAAYGEAVKLLEKKGSWGIAALMNLAAVAREAGQYGEAALHYESALDESRESGDAHLQARILNHLSGLYLFLGRLDRAGQLAHLSLKLAVGSGLRGLEGENYLLLSVIADKEGNVDSVGDLLAKAEAVFGEHGTMAERGTVALHRAYHHYSLGDDRQADDLLQSLRKEFPSEEHLQRQGDLLEGMIAARSGLLETGRGEEALERARSYFEAKEDFSNLWEVYFALGRLLRKKRPADSEKCLRKALALQDQIAASIPEEYREGFFRDRKRERILAELSQNKEDPIMSTPSLDEIVRINRLLASEHNLNYLLETVLEQSLEMLEAERGFVLLLEGKGFRVRISRNIDRAVLEKSETSDDPNEMRYSTTIARQVAVSGRSVLVSDAQADERFQQAASVVELAIRAALAVPMRIGAEIVGVIYVDNRFGTGAFDEKHQRLLEAFADQAALAIRNGRQVEEIRARQMDLESSKQKIEELNGLLREKLDVTERELSDVQEKYQHQQQDLQLRYSYDQIIGRSARLSEVLKIVDRVVDSDATVLILGESGTGKELIARALHYNSPRKNAPFIAENCSAFAETLLESELFGHKKGSFTDAVADKQGILEVADGGTVFLDEIGDMPIGIQSKLLRVLQERQIRPVGGDEYRKINVRVVAATHQDLKALVKEGKFREDLYYRINVVRVVLPPLRDRKEDIPLLVQHLLGQNRGQTKRETRIQTKALELLTRYDWPGNIRELQNEIQRCCAMGVKTITPEILSEPIREEPKKIHRIVSLGQQVSIAEKSVILETLKKNRYSRMKTAEALGVSRITLYKKMKAYGILALKPAHKSALAR